MNNTVKIIGKRIRNYRTQLKYSQEKLAELSGCHPTYIGQVERGEKNATIESIEKIANALNIPLEQLFETINGKKNSDNIPLKCYNLIAEMPSEQQKTIYEILLKIDSLKNI